DADPVDRVPVHDVVSEDEGAPIAEGLTVSRNEAEQGLVEGGKAAGRVDRIPLCDAREARHLVDGAFPFGPELLRRVHVLATSRFQIDQRAAPAATDDEVQDRPVAE